MDISKHNAYILGELAGSKARTFMKLILDRIKKHVDENLSGRVLKTGTGKLKRSVKTSITTSGLSVAGSISVGGGGKLGMIASIWEFTGRRGYTVTARRGKALKFKTSKGRNRGSYIFRRQVRIPKAAARPFVSPAIDKATPFITALHAKRYQEIFGPMNIEIQVGVDAT